MGSIQAPDCTSIGLNNESLLDCVSSDIAQSLLRLWTGPAADDQIYSTANLMPTPNGTPLYVNRNSFI